MFFWDFLSSRFVKISEEESVKTYKSVLPVPIDKNNWFIVCAFIAQLDDSKGERVLYSS